MGTLKSTLNRKRWKIDNIENEFPGRSISYRINTRFPAKSKLSMLNLFKAIVSCGMTADNRLITDEDMRILLYVDRRRSFVVFFARSILHHSKYERETSLSSRPRNFKSNITLIRPQTTRNILFIFYQIVLSCLFA